MTKHMAHGSKCRLGQRMGNQVQESLTCFIWTQEMRIQCEQLFSPAGISYDELHGTWACINFAKESNLKTEPWPFEHFYENRQYPNQCEHCGRWMVVLTSRQIMKHLGSGWKAKELSPLSVSLKHLHEDMQWWKSKPIWTVWTLILKSRQMMKPMGRWSMCQLGKRMGNLVGSQEGGSSTPALPFKWEPRYATELLQPVRGNLAGNAAVTPPWPL